MDVSNLLAIKLKRKFQNKAAKWGALKEKKYKYVVWLDFKSYFIDSLQNSLSERQQIRSSMDGEWQSDLLDRFPWSFHQHFFLHRGCWFWRRNRK
jgi:hypothetical protein